LAYNLIPPTGIVVKVYGAVNSLSLHQQSKVYPALVGSDGLVTTVP